MTTQQYNECVNRFSDGVYRFVLKNLRDEENARDIVQDAFLKMWEKSSSVDFEKAKSYLFTAAYHTMIDFIRKRNRFINLEVDCIDNQFAYNSFNDHQQIIEQALCQLPAVQKTVVLLRDYEGYSYDEIGKIVDLNESQVKVYIYRARLAMKKFIGNLESVL